MARVDIPTLQCDRCKTTTQDDHEMSKYRSLRGMYDKYQGANESWDLCTRCWGDFLMFVAGQGLVPPVVAGPQLSNREAGIQHDGGQR